MRHLKSGNRLGANSSHRKALMRNLVTALFEHGKIKTTLAKAKALRPDAEKLVTFSKKGDLHSRRMALKTLRTKKSMVKLFDDYSKLYKDRSGGYTRIYKIGNRLGDNAKMALIEMVDYTNINASLDNASDKISPDGFKTSVIEEVKESITDTKNENVSPLGVTNIGVPSENEHDNPEKPKHSVEPNIAGSSNHNNSN